MPTNQRVAFFLNGLLVATFSLATLADPRFVWLVILMGVSLIFSGTANFCGFAIMFDRFRQWRRLGKSRRS